MSFNIGLSGLHAASTDLEVTGNNIANASTTGFKKSRAEFGDVYTSTLLGTGSKPVGSGVMVDNVRQEFTQGNISGTGNVLDMAIDGNGFFVLEDRGNTSYTRSGIFTLDKNGFVVANNKSRLQGFPANQSGVVSGVLGDIQIQVTNQPPKLTNRVNAIYNLNAGEKILQEQGLKLESNGLVVGAANAGIIKSTTTTLNSSGQPTTGGTPATAIFNGDLSVLATTGYAAGDSIDIDLDGTPVTVTLAGVSAGSTAQDVVNDVQTSINTALGTQQITVSRNSSNELVLTRAGYQSSNGSNFSVTPSAGWTTRFGGDTVTGGTAGTPLFIGSNPQTVDFRSMPGSQTTTRTTATPPLNIVNFNSGTFASLTSGIYSPLDLTAGNNLSFTIDIGGGDSYSINLDSTNWQSAPAPLDPTAVTRNEVLAEINQQITNSPLPNNNNQVLVTASGTNAFQFTVQNPAAEGDYIQLSPGGGTSPNTLSNLGFTSANRYDSGVQPVLANNLFSLQVTSSTPGNTSSAVNITIPPANYARLEDVALAIQQQIDNSTGAGGLAGKVSVVAVGGQLVFTNTRTGQGEGIIIGGPASSVSALGFDSMFTVAGTDAVDRSNSFRVNLTVPAPDADQRSGSVLITLDEEFRSVQQLAASINRQLNAQDSNSYVGVQAFATEIVPNVVPPQYELEFRATKEGEASIISISNITASGPDITEAQLYGLLQVDPTNNGLLDLGIEGVSNMYPEQKVTITNPKGEETEVTIPERSQANEIVAMFNMQPGVTATAETTMTIPLSSFNSPNKSMTLMVNGQKLTSTSLADIADEINSFRSTTLPGFKAEIASNGDLIISNQVGRDVKVAMESPVVTDSLVVLGAENTGPMVLGGSATADRAAAVGGRITFILNEGYKMSNPDPVISGIFGALTEDEFESYTLKMFDPDDQDTYNHATSMEIYDSLGNPHVMTQYFVKEPLDPERPNEKNIWAMYVLIDGQDVGDPDSTLPFPQNLEPSRYRQEMFFNQDGSLDVVATGKTYITNWIPKDSQGNPNGAMGPSNVLDGGLPLREPARNSNFEVNLLGSTQHYGDFDVNEQKQNGYSTGRLTGLEIDDEGIIFARFTNGQALTLGQVALANFRNPEGLTPLGETGWAESYESGNPTVGTPRTASFGKVKSSSLEDSNVNLSDQLVRLIIAQRNFQANAKTIETTNQITQTILNI